MSPLVPLLVDHISKLVISSKFALIRILPDPSYFLHLKKENKSLLTHPTMFK